MLDMAILVHKHDVFMYGFSDEEAAQVESALPNKDSDVVPLECFTDIMALPAYAVIINASKICSDDLHTLFDYYTEAGSLDEAVIFVGNVDIPRHLARKLRRYEGFDLLMRDLKYLLLSASQQCKKYEDFSRSLAKAIVILSEIRKSPGTTTAQLADKLEISPRSVQRYIETLRMAGEGIEYDKSQKGWTLIDGKSILWGDI